MAFCLASQKRWIKTYINTTTHYYLPLKNNETTELQIQNAEPGFMDVGKNLNEAIQLLELNERLIHKLEVQTIQASYLKSSFLNILCFNEMPVKTR
jgi:hypothetical protein